VGVARKVRVAMGLQNFLLEEHNRVGREVSMMSLGLQDQKGD
jgi:hypothetical protein